MSKWLSAAEELARYWNNLYGQPVSDIFNHESGKGLYRALCVLCNMRADKAHWGANDSSLFIALLVTDVAKTFGLFAIQGIDTGLFDRLMALRDALRRNDDAESDNGDSTMPITFHIVAKVTVQ